MSTADKNLSDLDYNFEEDPSDLRIALVKAKWNNEITDRLLEGALKALKRCGITDNHIRVVEVPGSYELPMGAQMLLDECDPLPGAVICLGCVIRGETSHFNFVSQSVSQGIKDVGLKYNVPVIFGVLTDDTKEQSIARSGGIHGNKGEEAAVSGIEMALLQRKLRRS